MKILAIHRESKGVYGSPRITAELRDGGEVVTEKTVAKIMRPVGVVGMPPSTSGREVPSPTEVLPERWTVITRPSRSRSVTVRNSWG